MCDIWHKLHKPGHTYAYDKSQKVHCSMGCVICDCTLLPVSLTPAQWYCTISIYLVGPCDCDMFGEFNISVEATHCHDREKFSVCYVYIWSIYSPFFADMHVAFGCKWAWEHNLQISKGKMLFLHLILPKLATVTTFSFGKALCDPWHQPNFSFGKLICDAWLPYRLK